jgi:hypothetical protein
LNIGRFPNFGQHFNGRIGEVRYYGKALTQSEVTYNFNATKNNYLLVTDGLQLYLNPSDKNSYSGTGTTLNDLSTNGYPTTIVNSPSFSHTYFNFASSGQYIDTNQPLSSENFSVGAWFRSSASGIKMILSKETFTGNEWNYRIWLNGGRLTADISKSNVQSLLTSPLTNYNNGAWYYVMFTRDDDNWYLYVNGIQIATTTDPFTGSISTNQELWIGRSAFQGAGAASPTGSYQFIGDIGNVFIYNRVLNSTEITHNFNATKSIFGVN